MNPGNPNNPIQSNNAQQPYSNQNQQRRPPKMIKCPNCGNAVNSSWDFCPHCSRKIEKHFLNTTLTSAFNEIFSILSALFSILGAFLVLNKSFFSSNLILKIKEETYIDISDRIKAFDMLDIVLSFLDLRVNTTLVYFLFLTALIGPLCGCTLTLIYNITQMGFSGAITFNLLSIISLGSIYVVIKYESIKSMSFVPFFIIILFIFSTVFLFKAEKTVVRNQSMRLSILSVVFSILGVYLLSKPFFDVKLMKLTGFDVLELILDNSEYFFTHGNILSIPLFLIALIAPMIGCLLTIIHVTTTTCFSGAVTFNLLSMISLGFIYIIDIANDTKMMTITPFFIVASLIASTIFLFKSRD